MTYDNWRQSLHNLYLFHTENKIQWLWLPTPSTWNEKQVPSMGTAKPELRASLMSPRKALKLPMVWFAWDTIAHPYLPAEEFMQIWYQYWLEAML